MWWNKKVSDAEDPLVKRIDKTVSETVKKIVNNSLKDAESTLKLHKEVDMLTEERRKLKDDLADIKKQKELEKTELEHLVALKEERMTLQISQKEVELEKVFQKKELNLRQKAYDDMIARIEKAGMDMKEIYKEILVRLPNVNVKMKGQV